MWENFGSLFSSGERHFLSAPLNKSYTNPPTEYLSLKRFPSLRLSPKKNFLFVPQKGLYVCPPKRALCLSPQKDFLFVPQKGLCVCHPKRISCLSPKKSFAFVPHKGCSICPPKEQNDYQNFNYHSICSFLKYIIPLIIQHGHDTEYTNVYIPL